MCWGNSSGQDSTISANPTRGAARRCPNLSSGDIRLEAGVASIAIDCYRLQSTHLDYNRKQSSNHLTCPIKISGVHYQEK